MAFHLPEKNSVRLGLSVAKLLANFGLDRPFYFARLAKTSP